jgi:tetratricopeptide (TPR) repeat protein
VVIQSKAKEPMISGSNSEHWIQLKNNAASKNRVYGYMATGAWTSGIEEARKNLEETPGDPALTTALAASYAGLGNYEMAGYYASLALKSNSTNSDAMNLIGLRIMTRLGNRRIDYEEAMAWYRRAAEIDGTHIAALLNMGNLQLELGDAAGARNSFSSASSRCQECFAAQYGIGLASARSGSWQQAASIFQSIINKDKTRAEAQYQLAIVYKNGLSNAQKAIQLLQDIVSDSDGRFRHAGSVKRVANITLRRLKANDRTAPMPVEALEPR